MNNLTIFLSLILAMQVGFASAITQSQKQLARDEYPTDTLYGIWLQLQENEDAAVDFYHSLPERHIIEVSADDKHSVLVTYFAKGGDDTDFIMQSGGPDFYGLRFRRLGNSDIYFCLQTIPSDAWFTYGVNEFKKKEAKGVVGLSKHSMQNIYEGAIVGPDAPLSDYVKKRQRTPRGTLHSYTIKSDIIDEAREFLVYLPADYRPSVEHNLVIQFDGENYVAGADHGPVWRGWAPLPTILDNLIYDRKIGPTIAVFILNQGNRSGDLISEAMTDFVALELLPWVKEQYTIKSDARSIVVSGPSRAGFAAMHTAYRHSDLIGSVLSQSGSFYYTLDEKRNWPVYPEFEGKLISDYKRSPKKDIQFYIDVGLYDLGLAAVGTNRQLRDVLQLKGYHVDYYQYKGGHSYLGWRHTIAKGLVTLIGLDEASRPCTSQSAECTTRSKQSIQPRS